MKGALKMSEERKATRRFHSTAVSKWEGGTQETFWVFAVTGVEAGNHCKITTNEGGAYAIPEAVYEWFTEQEVIHHVVVKHSIVKNGKITVCEFTIFNDDERTNIKKDEPIFKHTVI